MPLCQILSSTYWHNDVSVLNSSVGYLIKNYQDGFYIVKINNLSINISFFIIYLKYLTTFTTALR
jgi:hypothetical protein